MPSQERRHGREGDQEPRHEGQQASYSRIARFRDEPLSGRVYQRVQDELYRSPCDLSVFRLQERGAATSIHYVVVLGSPPPAPLGARLDALLAAGEPAELDPATQAGLLARRARARQLGPWVEGHYRRGRPPCP